MKKGINRVVLVGTGAVGCSYAYCMINQAVAEEFVLVDVNEAKAEGEAMDLSHAVHSHQLQLEYGKAATKIVKMLTL